MTVERNNTIVIATLRNCLKEHAPVFQLLRSKKQNQPHFELAIFPALWTSYGSLLGILIGSSRSLLLLFLVGVITLVLVVRKSFENRSVIRFITSKFIKRSVMTMRNTMNRNHVIPGTVTSELKVSSKSNSPIIITAVFTQERPGLENPGCKRNE